MPSASEGGNSPKCLRQRSADAIGSACRGLANLLVPSSRQPTKEEQLAGAGGLPMDSSIVPIAEDSSQSFSTRKNGLEAGRTSSSSSEELMVVANPFADAVPLPSKESINAAKAANRQFSRTVSGTSSSESTDSTDSASHIQAYIQQHYNVGDDVVLRLEFIKERQIKAVLIGVWIIEALAVITLLIGLSLKLDKDQRYFLRTQIQEITNVVFGVPCWLALFVGGFMYVHRVVQATKTGKRWSLRRKRVVQKTILEHSIVFLNMSLWLAENLYVVSGRCRWFDGFVSIMGMLQWTCWNAVFAMFVMHAHDSNPWIRCTGMKGFRPDAIVMDAPRSYHLPKFLMFLVVEGLIIAIGILNHKGGGGPSPEMRQLACDTLSYKCRFTATDSVLTALVVVSFIGYFLAVVYFFQKAYAALREKPYNSMRMANLNIRIQARLRGLSVGFFVLCVILYVYVGYGTCVSYLQSWLGFLSMSIVITGVTVASTYLCMPNNPKENLGVLQVWLQEFAWSERELQPRRAERRSSMCQDKPCPMDNEPMFCFETSLKMLYWSMLVYRYEEADARGVTLEGAMALYNLQHFELLWERKLDTKALVAWNHDTVVLSFRGTASFKNVLADLKAWYATHPPKRGKIYLGTRPFVHQGFLRSWLASGLRTTVVNRVNEVVQGLKCSASSVRVFVTGHSLGGALAELAAFDIQAACTSLPRMSVICYTFGAPRVGNHAFAREYNERVPETWNVINDQDTVPRTAKFGVLYKRPGQRVLINSDGDLIVRPSFVEAAAQRRATSSVAHHLLVSYQRAHIAIIKAQFTSKRLRDGMTGVLAVAEACGMQNLLKAAGVEYEHLKKLQRLGTSGIPALPGLTSSSGSSGLLGKHKRNASQGSFSVDFDVAAVADAIERAEDAEAGEEQPSSSDDSKGNVQGGVNQLRSSTDEVRMAAAVAVLDDGVEEQPPEADTLASLASGGDMAVDDGQAPHLPRTSPPADVAVDIDALHNKSSNDGVGSSGGAAAVPPAVATPTAAAEVPPHDVMAARTGDGAGGPLPVPAADVPLQQYIGSLAAGRCTYTNLNGVKCPRRIADARRMSEGGFCRMKDKPKEADVVTGAAQGPFCSMADRPSNFKDKALEAVNDSVKRMLGR